MFNFFYKNLPLKKSIVTLLIIAMFFISGGYAFLLPKPAQAFQVADILGAGIAAGKWVWEGVTWVWDKGKTVLSTSAETTQAGIEIKKEAEHWANLAIQIIIETALRTLMSMLTNDIIAWVQSGYKGKPAFMDANFGDYLAEAGNNAGGNFITQFLGAGFLCEEFDDKIAKIPLLQQETPTEVKVSCTFKEAFKNMEFTLSDFYDDFSKGGWKGWLEVSAKPQNNFYGALLIAQSEKELKEQQAKAESERDAMLGGGYLSIKDCVWRDADGKEIEKQENIRGFPSLPDACKPNNAAAAGVKGPCKPKCDIKTPGSTVKDISNTTLTSGMNRINNTLANLAAKGGNFFKPYIMMIGEAVVNKLIQDGLSSLTSSGPSSSNPDNTLDPGQDIKDFRPGFTNLPADTYEEMIPVLTLEQTLQTMRIILEQYRIKQLKIGNLIKKLTTSENKDVMRDYDLFAQNNMTYTPYKYAPIEIFALFDFLKPNLNLNVHQSWHSMCAPCAHEDSYWCNKIISKANEDHGFLVREFTKDGVTTERISFEEQVKNEIYPISENIVEEKNNAGNVAKRITTTVEKKNSTYSFSILNIIGEGLFAEDTLITTIKTEEQDPSTTTIKLIITDTDTTIDPTNIRYSWIDWDMEIYDQNQNSIDLFKQSNNQESLAHFNAIFTNFIDRFKTTQQTEEMIIRVDSAIEALDEYIPIAENYFDIYKANLDNPNNSDLFDAETEMEMRKIIAIDAIKEINNPSFEGTEIFESDTFEDLDNDILKLSQKITEKDGELKQLIGNKDYPAKNSLYGLIKAVDEILPRLAGFFAMCKTGKRHEKLGG